MTHNAVLAKLYHWKNLSGFDGMGPSTKAACGLLAFLFSCFLGEAINDAALVCFPFVLPICHPFCPTPFRTIDRRGELLGIVP
jgi:hypothetical protein